MRLFRIAVAWLLVLGLSTAGFAGDIRESVANATFDQPPQTQQQQGIKIPSGYLWPGVAMFVGGMSMVLWGFLHTNDGQYVQVPPPGGGGVSTSSNTALGVSGFAVAGAGGALLFLGAKKGKSAPSIAVGPKGVSVVKRVAW
jgi:hypothetical protein